jgi:hypothetical protein
MRIWALGLSVASLLMSSAAFARDIDWDFDAPKGYCVLKNGSKDDNKLLKMVMETRKEKGREVKYFAPACDKLENYKKTQKLSGNQGAFGVYQETLPKGKKLSQAEFVALAKKVSDAKNKDAQRLLVNYLRPNKVAKRKENSEMMELVTLIPEVKVEAIEASPNIVLITRIPHEQAPRERNWLMALGFMADDKPTFLEVTVPKTKDKAADFAKGKAILDEAAKNFLDENSRWENK